MADPVVGITNGVPTSGTGTITTLGQTLLDGANIAQGATTDAAVAAGAAGSLSAKLRSISRDLVGGVVLQAGANVVGGVTVADGSDATQGAKADAAYTGSGAASVVAALKGLYAAMIAATPAGSNLIGSVTVAASTTDVAVTPTVTASAYTAGNVIGGIMTFASVLAATTFNGVLQSITAKFKGAAVTGTISVAIFKASPSNGTYTDKTAPTWNALDMANLLGVYQLNNPLSPLGAETTYNLDAIGKAIVGASQSLFAVAIVSGTPTPASTSDFTLELSVLPG